MAVGHRVAMIVRVPEWLKVRRDTDRWWHVVATLVAVLATAAAVGALSLHKFATSSQLIVLVTALSHQLMWAAPIGLGAALAARRWTTSAVASVACVLVGVVQIPANISTPYAGKGRDLVVLQANLKIGSADPDVLTRLVRDHHVDILATEELTDAEEAALIDAGLPALLPHRYTAPLVDGGGGLGMWSRFPLSDTHNVPGYSAGLLTARVAVSGHQLTFVALHLSPPYRQPFPTWRGEIASLGGTLSSLPASGPVIAAGDFNATVDHAQFRDPADRRLSRRRRPGRRRLPTDVPRRPLVGSGDRCRSRVEPRCGARHRGRHVERQRIRPSRATRAHDRRLS